jgi:hypothetical protein
MHWPCLLKSLSALSLTAARFTPRRQFGCVKKFEE